VRACSLLAFMHFVFVNFFALSVLKKKWGQETCAIMCRWLLTYIHHKLTSLLVVVNEFNFMSSKFRIVVCRSNLISTRRARGSGLPWISISVDISMCGYQTSAILRIYPWILCCRIC